MMAAKSRSKTSKTDTFITEFMSNPDKAHWSEFSRLCARMKAKYYAVVFPGGLGGKADLSKAYAIIYNAARKPLYKVPIIMRSGKSIEGATIMFRGLELNRSIGV